MNYSYNQLVLQLECYDPLSVTATNIKGCGKMEKIIKNKIAWVMGFNDSQIIVKCPFCGKKHYHGLAKQAPTDKELGTRVPHCQNNEYKDQEYEIKRKVMLHEFV